MEITKMGMQPLWLDISKHQGAIDFDKIKAIEGYDKVYGIISRAGWGADGGYIDQTFERNWAESAKFDYRTSYWAYWDYFPLMHQLDLWYRTNPTIDLIPRMWDLEIELAHPQFLSDQTWLASEEVLRRDGKRFIIYSNEAILERTLCKYWTPEQLNVHKFMLAQYDLNDPNYPDTIGEYMGIRVPDNINPENILWKQTTSSMPIYVGSGFVDRDRWIWTDAETMHDDIQEFWGKPTVTPPPQPDCCAELKISVDELDNEVVVLQGKTTKLRTDVDSIEVRSNDNHVRLGVTRTELGELTDSFNNLKDNKLIQLERGIGENLTNIGRIDSEIEVCSKNINDIHDNIDNYMSEIEGRVTEIEDIVDKLNTKITIIGWLRKLFGQSDE